jgi:branched-chain amino acid transport system substrate-binding protein
MQKPEPDRDTRARIARRHLLRGAAWMAGAVATGAGGWVLPAREGLGAAPIKVGIATDLTGAIGIAGNSDLNVAKMCADLINKSGGLLGRPIELHVEDTASNEGVAVGNVRRLIQRDRVDVVLGGITSSMRNAIKGPIVERGHTLYIYPQLYEGGECEKFIYCTGPTPAQQCDDLIPWLVQNGGKRFAFPSANYIWPHRLNEYARNLVQRHGGEVVFEEYYPLDQIDYSATVNRIMTNNVDVVFNTVIPPGVGPFFKQLYEAGFLKRGGRLSCGRARRPGGDGAGKAALPDADVHRRGEGRQLRHRRAEQGPCRSARVLRWPRATTAGRVRRFRRAASSPCWKGRCWWPSPSRRCSSPTISPPSPPAC